MRSAHVDRFNHDADASAYDRDVADESHPIRAGYQALLDWVAAQMPPGREVVDLGSGTGNLAVRLDRAARIICVDVSAEMTRIARDKLADRPCQFVCAGLLECFEQLPVVDGFASTYAVHHLTADEKAVLFRQVRAHLRPGGKAVFGDLMFESAAAAAQICQALAKSHGPELAADIEDEFCWYLDAAIPELEHLGFRVEQRRFSELSWGLAAELIAR